MIFEALQSELISLYFHLLSVKIPKIRGFNLVMESCRPRKRSYTLDELVTKTANGTFIDFGGLERTYEELWTRRMVNIQGAIILAGIFEFLIGLSGIVGVIMRFIGPLTISPVICLIGLSVMEPALEKASQNWVISCFCISIIILCSQILNEIEFQIGGVKIPIFGLFPVLIGLVTSYILCCIITFSVDWEDQLTSVSFQEIFHVQFDVIYT